MTIDTACLLKGIARTCIIELSCTHILPLDRAYRSLLLDLKAQDVRASVMANRIKVQLGPNDCVDVDIGVQDPFLIPQRASEDVAERIDNGASSTAPHILLRSTSTRYIWRVVAGEVRGAMVLVGCARSDQLNSALTKGHWEAHPKRRSSGLLERWSEAKASKWGDHPLLVQYSCAEDENE